MSAVEANVQSAQYVDFWNEVLVPKFIKYKHILVDGLTHHSEAIFPSLPVNEGDRVLDIGCGFGDTAIKLAQRVGKKGLRNVSFVYGDALLDHFEPEYDFVFSRFGTMFFANPVAGLRNMRTALISGRSVASSLRGADASATCVSRPKEPGSATERRLTRCRRNCDWRCSIRKGRRCSNKKRASPLLTMPLRLLRATRLPSNSRLPAVNIQAAYTLLKSKWCTARFPSVLCM